MKEGNMGKKLLTAFLAFAVVLFMAGFAQAETYYVDATNGLDSNDGLSQTDQGGGVGPFATIGQALSTVVDGDEVVIMAANTPGYDNAHEGAATLTVSNDITITAEELDSVQEVLIGGGGNVDLVIDATVSLGTSGTGFFTIGDEIELDSGTLTIAGANVHIADGATVTRRAGSLSEAFTLDGMVDVMYDGSANLTAGPELPADLAGGILTNTGTGGIVTVNNSVTANNIVQDDASSTTFNNNVTVEGGDVAVSNAGDVNISGVLTLGNNGLSHSGTGDVVVADVSVADGFVWNQSTGTLIADNITFTNSGNLTGNGNGNAIENSGGAGSELTVNSDVTFAAAVNDNGVDDTFTTVPIENSGAGSLTIAGSLAQSSASDADETDTFDAPDVVKSSTGAISLGMSTIDDLDYNTSSSGSIAFTGNSTINELSNTAGGTIDIGSTTLTVATGTAAHDNGNGTIQGSGTLAFADGGSDHTVNNAGALPGLQIDRATTLDDAAAPADPLAVSGNVSANANLTISNDDQDAEVDGNITVANGATVTTNVANTLSVTGDIDNDGDLDLNGVLLAAGNITNTSTSGTAIDFGAASTIDGTLMTSAGTVTMAANLDVTNFNMSGDNTVLFEMGNNTLTVNGDFTRTGGEVTTGGTALLSFAGTDQSGTFTAGPQLNIDDLEVNKAGRTLTITQSINVSGDFIHLDGTIELGSKSIRITNTGTADLDGALTTTGGGGIVFNGTGGSLEGVAPYTNITINVGSGNIVNVTNDEEVTFTGTLFLNSGALNVADGAVGAPLTDISPSGSEAAIKRNPETSGGITLANDGTFNADDVDYDLEYTGVLTGAVTVTVGSSEFDTDNVVDLTVSTQAFPLILASGSAVTVTGNLTVEDPTGDGDATEFQLDTGTPFNMIVEGDLMVAANSTLSGGDAGNTITLSKASGAHSVVGTISAASDLIVSGDGAVVTGSTDEDMASALNIVSIGNGADAAAVTISDIQEINGTLDVDASAGLTLGMFDGGNNAGEGEIDGLFSVDAGATGVTLASDITALNSGFDIDGGTYDNGGFNLTVEGGNFDGASGVTYAGGGTLVLNTAAGTFGTNGEAIMNVQVDDLASLSSNVEISGLLDLNIALDDAGNNVILSGDAELDANIAGAGVLEVVGTTLTAESNVQIENLTINTDGTSTFATDDPQVAREFTVTGAYVHTKGGVGLGINDLILDDATFDYTAGTYSMTTGKVVLDDADDDGLNSFATNDGVVTIPNLKLEVNGGADPAQGTGDGYQLGADDGIEVTDNLWLINGTLDVDASGASLTIGDGANIVRDVGALAGTPSFGSDINVTYSSASSTSNLTTATELPAMVDVLTIDYNNDVILDKDLTASTVMLSSGNLDEDTNDLTIASGGLLSISGGNLLGEPTVTEYTLRYTTAMTTNDQVFQNGPGITVDLEIDGPVVTLHANKTVRHLTVGSQLDLDGNALSVLQNITFAVTNPLADAAGSGQLRLEGDSSGTMTVPAAGVTLPSGSNTDVVLAKNDDESQVTLMGGNLDFSAATAGNGADLVFNNGLLVTGDNKVILDHNFVVSTQTADQGYDRSVVEANASTNRSHIVGNVEKLLDSQGGRVEFPVGTLPSTPGDYRPYALIFDRAQNASDFKVPATDVTVNHVNADPMGLNGIPIEDGVRDGVDITNYPSFYWLVQTSTNDIGPSVEFDVEAAAQGYTNFPEADVEDIRFIRRFDGNAETNQWVLQGDPVNYDNLETTDPTTSETFPTVIVRNATGGLNTQGARYTLSQSNLAPDFISALPDTAIDEGDTLQFTYEAEDRDINQTFTLSALALPEAATFDSTTGEFEFITDAQSAGTYTVTIRAEDNTGAFTDTSATITVNDVNIAPSFTSVLGDTSVTENTALEFMFEASDPEADDVLSFGFMGSVPTGATIVDTSGMFSWTPTSAQADSTYMITVYVTDDVDTVQTVSNITVEQKPLVWGDVSQNGEVSAFDASLVLQHAVGSITLTGDSATVADVSGNGDISAFDASYILQYVAGIITEFPVEGGGMAKTAAAAMGNVDYSTKKAQDKDAMLVNLGLDESTQNVKAIDLELRYDATQVSISDLTTALPKDWMVAQNTKDGVMQVAMAGTTPITAGEFGQFTVNFTDKKASASLNGSVTLNETVNRNLSGLTVKNVPNEYALNQNYPNPFNPTTTIEYQLPEDTRVNVSIYNMVGKKVKTLVSESKEAGYHEIQWDATNEFGSKVSAGVYFYRITTGEFSKTHKMVLIK